MHKHLNIIPAITRRHNKPAYVEFVFISGHSLRNIEEGASGLEDRPWESPVAGFGRVFFPQVAILRGRCRNTIS